jgi:type VI secretion system protein ImpF
MARNEASPGLTPSILDRLLEPESEGTSWRRGYTVEQMIDSVRRDLEDLLNSHRTLDQGALDLVEVNNSIVAFGLPDLVSVQSAKAVAQERVCAAIADAIVRFEPRLINVRVLPVSIADPKVLKLEIQIQATLRVDPAPEVSFVTVLQLTTGETTIQRINE